MAEYPSILATGIKRIKNVERVNIGSGSLGELPGAIAERRAIALQSNAPTYAIFFVDEYFRDQDETISRLGIEDGDFVHFVETEHEPKTDGIDRLVAMIRDGGFGTPSVVVGMGGGITMDTAKAVSNLLTNEGSAADFQGWDLVKRPGVYKIGIPTVSGTGAEATRTCVMTNTASGLKLGMNSDFTVFNHVILDFDLTKTVPRDQYLFTGMDAYIHSIESLAGSYRNAIGDAFSRENVNLCRAVFSSEDMMSDEARENLMVASYLGGLAIATSYVGIVHPFSAGLSVVLGTHHCVGNCIVMRGMEEFYPREYDEFWTMVERQNVTVPTGIARDLTDRQYQALIDATVIHTKPLTNALGENYRTVLTDEKIIEIFRRM